MYVARFVVFCSIAVAFASASVARAAHAESRAEARDGGAWSLADAIARAEARAPEVAIARHVVRDAEARRVGAGIVMPQNPRLSVDARPVLRGGSASDVGYAATADFLFEVGGAPGARREEADRGVAVASTELHVQRNDARARAWAAYVRAQLAAERIREAQFAVEIGNRVLAASRERAEAGASGDIDRTLAESEVAQLQAAVSAAEQRRERELMALRDALDLPADAPLTLTTTVTMPGDVPDAAVLAQRALAARPDLEAIRKRMDLLDATRERLEREVFPRVGAYVGVDATPLSPMVGIVGLSVEIPVAQRNQGPRARVAAQREGEAERLDLEARRIVRDVHDAVRAYRARRHELALLETGALPTAARTLELVESGWRSGRFDIFRVTSAARDLERVRALRLEALEATWMERIALDRAVGGLDR